MSTPVHNNLAMDQNINLYRITNITLKNFLFINIVNSPGPLVYLVGNFNSEGYIINTEFRDVYQSYIPVGTFVFKSIMFKDLAFNNFTNTQYALFGSMFCLSIIYDTIAISSFTFDQFANMELIVLNNLNFTYTLLSNIYLNNITLYNHPVINPSDLISSITIIN